MEGNNRDLGPDNDVLATCNAIKSRPSQRFSYGDLGLKLCSVKPM